MQDHARPHTAGQTSKWLSNNDILTMHSWPPMGADINPIENLWAFLDEQARKRKVTTKKFIENAIMDFGGYLEQ